MDETINVLFLAAEADPFVKVGGLGDVAGSLPLALHHLQASDHVPGVNVRLVLPYYGAIQQKALDVQPIYEFSIPSEQGRAEVKVLSTSFNEIPVYFVAGNFIPEDAPVYTTVSEDAHKFVFFSMAALELARRLTPIPHILHANDWHTAPAIYALSLNRQVNSFYQKTATVLGLHNLPYLGVGSGPALAAFGLPPAYDPTLPDWAQHAALPLGILSADKVVAVSPHYAEEIMTPEYGAGLHQFIQTRNENITGILNGIDTDRWDPQTDPLLVNHYHSGDFSSRLENKLALQAELGLETNPDIPLLAMVGRLDAQKGVDLIPPALHDLAHLPWQAIFLGTGSPFLEDAIRGLQEVFPERVRSFIRFDSALSHRIYSGTDVLLIPSRYEPCGLTQMIGMRYGAVPVARATGGLSDTIIDFNSSPDCTGFLFQKATSDDLAEAVQRAITVFSQRGSWKMIQERCLNQDFSWKRSARQYRDLYLNLMEKCRNFSV